LTTEADDQSSLHCVTVTTDVMYLTILGVEMQAVEVDAGGVINGTYTGLDNILSRPVYVPLITPPASIMIMLMMMMITTLTVGSESCGSRDS